MSRIADANTDIGNERETAFFMLTRVTEQVRTSSVSDFQINGYTFEIGGKKKGRKQLADVQNGIVVKDDIEYASEYYTDTDTYFRRSVIHAAKSKVHNFVVHKVVYF